MENSFSRRKAIKTLTRGAAVAAGGAMLPFSAAAENIQAVHRKGNINHSVCQWCYDKMPLEDLCRESKK
ncbi:MAG: hydroxypyruvate isomerase, partial [Chitinophagaceae bacterium]|nr:hydroxypyruvate isomerase [Chitinophagaceae bacterium]